MISANPPLGYTCCHGDRPESVAEREHAADVIQDVLLQYAENSIYTLADSRHAPSKTQRERKAVKAVPSVVDKPCFRRETTQTPFTSCSNRSSQSTTPAKTQDSRLSSSKSTSPSCGSEREKEMAKRCNIDDAAAFMAAFRSRRQSSMANTPASTPAKKVDDSSVSEAVNESPVGNPVVTPVLKPKDDNSYIEPISITLNSSSSETSQKEEEEKKKKRQGSSNCSGLAESKWAAPEDSSGRSAVTSKDPVSTATTIGAMQAGNDTAEDLKSEKAPETKVSTASAAGENREHTTVFTSNAREKPAVEEESREHQTIFSSWGTPAHRDKPAAQVRRIIIRDLPPSWNTPSKVLSLIYGGAIESVSVAPSGNTAHVLFCSAEACKTYYDKYPNGIVLSRDTKQVVFVDMGKDVDVVSSQLSLSLGMGATRVVRVVGVDMHISMDDLLKVASSGPRKVEKILDSYAPGESRIVQVRFCSIDDAVRFRSVLVRDENWEHCNINFAPDPCETATGIHFD
ncbi:hypothetical protein VTN02DRAFT_2474 [Thermoascus thermophilus]